MKNTILLIMVFLAHTVAGQHIGIGTNTPGFKLHVVSNSSNTEIARFQSAGGVGIPGYYHLHSPMILLHSFSATGCVKME